VGLASSWFGQFMASGTGRVVRVIAGLALIGIGLSVVQGTAGAVMAVVGLVPLGAGAFDVCVISALFGGPFSGQAIRDPRPR
jgi:hypothetical protein